jgi:hypothetical protein
VATLFLVGLLLLGAYWIFGDSSPPIAQSPAKLSRRPAPKATAEEDDQTVTLPANLPAPPQGCHYSRAAELICEEPEPEPGSVEALAQMAKSWHPQCEGPGAPAPGDSYRAQCDPRASSAQTLVLQSGTPCAIVYMVWLDMYSPLSRLSCYIPWPVGQEGIGFNVADYIIDGPEIRRVAQNYDMSADLARARERATELARAEEVVKIRERAAEARSSSQ